MSGNSINSTDYNPTTDLQRLLPDPSALTHLRSYVNYTNRYKLSLDTEIANNEAEFARYAESSGRFNPALATQELEAIITEIEANKELSLNTQNVITSMTSGIKRLDDAKKNLVLTMTVLKRVQMMLTAYEQLDALVDERRYTEALPLLGAVYELVDHFKSYKSIDAIAELTRSANKLKIKLADQVFRDFELTMNGKDPLPESELRSACGIMDLLGAEYHDRLLVWFCNQQLREIKTIFVANDEAGSLDNLSRRFMFFKRVLKNFEEHFQNFFLESWKMEEQLTAKFCEHTRDSIKQVLSDSGGKTDVDVLLSALQQTLDFEKFLNSKFKYTSENMESSASSDFSTPTAETPKFTHQISSAFEPFLSIWVDHQNTFLQKKFMQFLAAPKLPTDSDDHHIVPSSADLFRAYRQLLTQCSNLSTGAPLRDLSRLFQKWAIEYRNKILKTTLPPTTNLNDEAITYIALVLNTADYCNTTMGQLEERLLEIIDEPFKPEINFDPTRESFIRLINQCLNLLLAKIESEAEFAWREMANTNWSHMEDVGDQSRYIATLKDIILKNCGMILPKFTRDIYVRNLCDKVVETTVNEFLFNIVKTKPIPVVAAEQMLLDLSVLKETFLKLPKQAGENSKSSSQFQKHVDKMVGKLEIILKVLLTQDAPQEGLVTNYFYLIGDKSVQNFVKVLELKGISDKARQTKYIDLFNIHMKAHDNLVDSSPALANLEVQGDKTQAQPSSHILTSKVKVPDFPNSPKFDSKFENILKKDNIEKSFKELQLNSEAGVSKLNKSLGRFFNRNNVGQ